MDRPETKTVTVLDVIGYKNKQNKTWYITVGCRTDKTLRPVLVLQGIGMRAMMDIDVGLSGVLPSPN